MVDSTKKIDTIDSSTSTSTLSSLSGVIDEQHQQQSIMEKSDPVTSSSSSSSKDISLMDMLMEEKGNYYRCTQCYKRFSTKERFDKHLTIHDESAKKLSCDVCDRKFLTKSALSCHVRYHQFSSDVPRKYDCLLCDKVFDNIQLRREHISVHINPDTGLFHCPKCTK
ncbi:hypothetical protein BLA29_009686, partial [Euroglyphus maynei]